MTTKDSPQVLTIEAEVNEKAPDASDGSSKENSVSQETVAEETSRLSGTKLVVLIISLMAGMFMVALDGSIISTAIPRITTEFNSINDISWYASGFLLTQISLQPTFGRVYTFFNVKYTYLFALLLFEAGSTICATAPNSKVFIIGRAIAGIGSAGVFAGDQTIIYHSISIRKRPMAMSFVGSMFGIASVLSPPIGGFITDAPRLGWRFCFWINLPFGAIAAAILLWTYKPPKSDKMALPLREKLSRLDAVGAIFLISGVVCLLLSLQWGGSVYPWSDSKVWGCLLGFALLSFVFIGSQKINQTRATIPYHIISKKAVALSCLFIFALQMSIYVQSYYLPVWFQSALGTSATDSGIRTLPYGVATSLATLLTGYLMSKTGQYVPFMWVGAAIFTIGTALLHTFTTNSPIGQWLTIETVASIGFGICTQIAFFPVQNELDAEDISTGVSLIIFSQGLGAALGLSIAGNIFNDLLTTKLRQLPGIDSQSLLAAGASAEGIRQATPPNMLPQVLGIYNEVLVCVFILPAVAAGLSFCFSLAVPWKKIKKEN